MKMNSARERILRAVRENRGQTEVDYPPIPDFPKKDTPLLEEFKENLVLAAGRWFVVEQEDEVMEWIRKLHPDEKVICSATPEVKGNKDLEKIMDPHELNEVDVGVLRAKFGVAEMGMVWMTEEDLCVNALGFLSQHLVILLDPAQIVRDMHEAYARIQLNEHAYGCFMLGPSATADIGAYMVRGAQGARSLTVLLKKVPE